MSQFYKSHLTAHKREILIFGYVRINSNIFIPLDIARLFLMMFGDNTIYWKIAGDDFQFLINPERISLKSILNLELRPYALKSASLKIHNIEFTLKIEKKQNVIILSVSSTETDDQYVITRYTMYCEETKYEYRKFTDNRDSEAVEWTQDFMTVSDIKQMGLKSINFVCKIEILHVYQKHTYNNIEDDEMIEAYYSNIAMKNKIDYKWLIYENHIQTKTHSLFDIDDDKKQHFASYYSPFIDNNNWCVLFTESKTRFGVQLQLLSLPFGIVSIMVKWECCLLYKGKYKENHKYEEIFEFGFESDSVLSHGWNKKDIIDGFWTEYDKDDQTKAQMKQKMLNNNNDTKQYVKDIMIEIKFEILMVKEYNENIVFRENWPLYGIDIIDDDHDDVDRDGNIVIVGDFDQDSFSWNYMISALKKEFQLELKQQSIKYENELRMLRHEINKLLTMKTVNNIKYDINEESVEEVNLWLYAIGMSMYFDTFIKNGFDSIKMITQINDKHDLNDIGIKLKAHQLTILNAINILKQ